MNIIDLAGIWTCEIPGQRGEIRLPGTLDEAGLGHPDDPLRQWKVDEVQRIGFWQKGDPIVTRLTRKYLFEGQARISKTLSWAVPQGKRMFVDVERARHLRLLVNGQEVSPFRVANISTPYTFEITGLVTGQDELTFLSDNSYPGWPREAIVYASAASDETQTNWNGLLGGLYLRVEEPVFFSDLRVYPQGDHLDVCVETNASQPWQGEIQVSSSALAQPASMVVQITPGLREIWLRGLKAVPDALRWDLEEGNLQELTVSAPGLDSRSVSFGLRDFRTQNGCLTLNGRRIFLRSEANCAVFPETGYIPMTVEAWLDILKRYRGYGVNCMRFHSHCPPEAAFLAADQLGMLMQPELSHWDPEHAFASKEARNYYQAELMQILRHLANHPSFVMLSFGNELHADKAGHAFMDQLLREARAYDSTRLYANGSNPHYGALGPDPESDFYTSMCLESLETRATNPGPEGWLNHAYPDLRRTYDPAVAELRRRTAQSIFSFEVGQYEVLPDFAEIQDYRGVTSPENLKHIQRKVQEKGLEGDWARRVEATGESSLLCYRAEVEAALRTEGYSGISLLGIQDFPGQGTALVGMMNAHLHPKPYAFAQPERFAAFFRDVLPLALLPRFTFVWGEDFSVQIKLANYGKKELVAPLQWRLEGASLSLEGSLPEISAPAGSLTDLGLLSLTLPEVASAEKLILTLSFTGFENEYPLWVYPQITPHCPAEIYECRSLDATAEKVLAAGGTVYLSPDSTAEALPHSIPAQFSPDFWSVCTFPEQAGGMGQLIDTSHPLFRRFPTDSHTDWQWWPMATQRAMILPNRIECIVEEMDSYAFLRPMAQLFECRCGAGRLLVSSLGLHQLQQYPEARAMQQAIYDYLISADFQPKQTLSLDWIHRAVK